MGSTAGSEGWTSISPRICTETSNNTFETLVEFIEEQQRSILDQLLLEQVKLQEENDFKAVLNNYEEKIDEMNYTLFNKEVDITNDHVGKK